jgi:hypothetical protein
MHRSLLLACASLVALACSSAGTGDTDTDASSGGTTAGSMPTTVDPTTGPGPTTSTADPTTGEPGTTTTATTTTATTTDATTDPSTTDPSATDTGLVCIPLECDGALYACGDCMDNDGDGKIDTADPECVSPCDDKEDTFATGLPGDNMDPCKQDCFFDGNSGGGAGDCAWNLACDPKNPGGDKCPYDENKMCPMEQSQECVETCQVPNGCDCFGCCTVEVDGTAYDVYIGDPDCSLANIDSCAQCSKNDDCDDECDPNNCEVCFGQDLPDECDMPMCDNEMPCTVDDMGASDCPADMFCSTGCCAPIVPG